MGGGSVEIGGFEKPHMEPGGNSAYERGGVARRKF